MMSGKADAPKDSLSREVGGKENIDSGDAAASISPSSFPIQNRSSAFQLLETQSPSADDHLTSNDNSHISQLYVNHYFQLILQVFFM